MIVFHFAARAARPVLFALFVLLLALPALSARAAGDDGTAAFNVIRQFYAERDYKPLWTAGAAGSEHFTPAARALPGMLAGAARHGIDPETYGVARMRAMLSNDPPAGQEAYRQAELFFTYNLYAYASDLAGMKLDAATLASVVDGDIADNLASLAPDTKLYHALQERLALLDAEHATPTAGVPDTLSFGRNMFRPGMSAPMVPLLRARMVSFGAFDDLPADAGQAPTLYDKQLARAVGRFQNEYGLTDDGTIGPVTLKVLNRGGTEEREQVIANLQRLREPHRRLREDRRVEVSIARYWLKAYDAGREVLSMPVIVGQPKRQTISFRAEITGVRLNPTWSVPPTIKKEDFIPQLLRDPARLMRRHPVKVYHDGRNVDPTRVDWSQMSPHELMQVAFTQPAGDGNPLGRYRVIMANPYDIYLHDTNHPELFRESMRAQSSGCVRLSRPEDLAAFILNGKQDWNAEKTAKIVKSSQTTDVVIENKIPIYLDYLTAWFNDRDQLILGVDVYGLDKPRYDALVKNGLTTQRNAQSILARVPDILEPPLAEAHLEPSGSSDHKGEVIASQSTN
ncbi:MAG: L,D-transpeptidase family protein [Rhodospirillales bacterium]|nr:L,D-transpeptidase family protein [Alphaproteobacteria bacterium]MCB9986109.1 L,D-transpeptidase family protein [Rhodospirillales bacterium]USO07330.1 MAG: L,D-transpeptidase family protein [Rhodospirillales bacterium]